MSRKHSIQVIESPFPADSKFPGTAEIGEKLCLQAIAIYYWRDLPEKVLETYRRLCEVAERMHGKKMF